VLSLVQLVQFVITLEQVKQFLSQTNSHVKVVTLGVKSGGQAGEHFFVS